MDFRAVLAAMLISVVSMGAAHAQSRDPLGPILSQRCRTSECEAAQREIQSEIAPQNRIPISPENVSACMDDNYAVGQVISRASFYVTKHEISRGGVLTYDEASRIRSLFFTETYYIRETINDYTGKGDVSQCHRFRDKAISIIKDLIQSNPVGSR